MRPVYFQENTVNPHLHVCKFESMGGKMCTQHLEISYASCIYVRLHLSFVYVRFTCHLYVRFNCHGSPHAMPLMVQ